jgi:anaerobic selenocysteine-containing dehydrogenase
MLTPGPGQVRGLLTVAGNPVLSTPDGARLDEALDGLEFRVAVDIYLNETTRHADVILPPTTTLERDHYDLAFHALAVRNTTRFSPAVLAKPDDARHDWEIFRDLTLALLRRSGRSQTWRRWAVTQTRMRLSPTRLVDGLLRSGGSRLSVRALRRRPEGIDLGPLTPRMPERLMTRTKRVDLVQELPMGELPKVLALADAAGGDGKLLLIGRRHQRDCNSWMHNTERLTRGRPRHQLLMHPDDLAARGLTDGATVEVASRVGAVRVEVAASEDVMAGVVSLPHGYGHARAEGMAHARGVPGVSINDLTDPELVDVSGNAAFNGVPVTVSAG